MTDPLSRLRAGLDRDEAIARAASPSPWHANAEHDEVIAVDDIEVCTGFALSGNQQRATVDHIVEFDPSRVLRQVQVFRELADEARFVLGKNDPGLTDAGTLAESVLELLASIYPEDTTETGDSR